MLFRSELEEVREGILMNPNVSIVWTGDPMAKAAVEGMKLSSRR